MKILIISGMAVIAAALSVGIPALEAATQPQIIGTLPPGTSVTYEAPGIKIGIKLIKPARPAHTSSVTPQQGSGVSQPTPNSNSQ